MLKQIMLNTAISIFSCVLAAAQQVEAQSHQYSNELGMEFVLIPAGSFVMGSQADLSEARNNERPQHKVTISKAFYIGKFEVTQSQWKAVMGANPYDTPRSNSFYGLPGMAERLRHPDNPATVSWEDTQEFIERLNNLVGHPVYRLPTEAEWEYATRAGTSSAYSFGDQKEELGKYAWYGEGFDSGSTHQIGKKEPNGWGLHDVHGNVWEWVYDWYGKNYFKSSPLFDPQGPETGEKRVVRGGSWHHTADSWRSAFRKSYPPDYRGLSIGFRLVRKIDDNPVKQSEPAKGK